MLSHNLAEVSAVSLCGDGSCTVACRLLDDYDFPSGCHRSVSAGTTTDLATNRHICCSATKRWYCISFLHVGQSGGPGPRQGCGSASAGPSKRATRVAAPIAAWVELEPASGAEGAVLWKIWGARRVQWTGYTGLTRLILPKEQLAYCSSRCARAVDWLGLKLNFLLRMGQKGEMVHGSGQVTLPCLGYTCISYTCGRYTSDRLDY
jgi:hypothetical protein